MLRAVFFGSDLFSVPVLQALVERGPNLRDPVQTVGVITQPDRAAGRGRRLEANPVKRIAELNALPVMQPVRVRDEDAVSSILELEPDVAVVASYGQIIPRTLLNGPRHAFLNLHPSLLPQFRGPSPVAGAILAGHQVTGTSLMLMTVRMDAGPVIDRVETRIESTETCGELTQRLAGLSADLLTQHLPDWLEDRLEPIPQDESIASYTRLLTKNDGRIDWNEPAVMIARKALAFNPWPGAFTQWNGQRFRVLRAHARDGDAQPGSVLTVCDAGLVVGTGSGLLVITEAQLAGGTAQSARNLVRGHGAIMGATLGNEM